MYRVCSPGTLLALRGAALTSGGMGSVPKGALGHCPLLAPSCTHLMHTPMPPQSVQSCCQLGFFLEHTGTKGAQAVPSQELRA